jgi:hypothetical protein
MGKMKLHLDALAVESFETAETLAARGTVLGHEEYSYFCDTRPECRTGAYASCGVTRCYMCVNDSSTCP